MASAEKSTRLYRSGLEAYHAGRVDEAVRNLRRAIDLEPANADRRYDLAVMLQESRRHADAAAEYRRVLRMRGDAVDALSNLALCLMALGELAEAEALARRAVALAPGSARALHNLGVVLRARGDASGAVAALERAAGVQPASAAVWNDLGEAHLLASDYPAAERCFRHAVGLDPVGRPARSSLGRTLAAGGRLEEAETTLLLALAEDPDDAAALDALAVTLLLGSRLDEALAVARASVRREEDPKYLATLGCIHQAAGECEAALAAFGRAARLDPGSASAQFNLANALLALGRFEEGWAAFRAQPGRRTVHAPDVPRLGPEDVGRIEGRRIALVGEFGLGDELFLLRFAALLRERGARLAYWGDPRLQPMLARTGLFDAVAGYADELSGADFLAYLADLPALLGDRAGLPRPPPLRLVPDPDRVARFRALLAAAGRPPYVGVTWQGGLPADRFDALRRRMLFKRVEPAALAAVLAGGEATLVVVQRAPSAADLAAFGRGAPDLSAANDDLEDALALMAVLDDYVAVSNTNVHLRAAVGRPARVLVPLPAEWRWQSDDVASPWFPGFAVYREMRPGGWVATLERLRRDLAGTVPA